MEFTKPSTTTLYYHLSHVHFINLKKLPPKGKQQSNRSSSPEPSENAVEEAEDDPDPNRGAENEVSLKFA